jgi:hypothetical protein
MRIGAKSLSNLSPSQVKPPLMGSDLSAMKINRRFPLRVRKLSGHLSVLTGDPTSELRGIKFAKNHQARSFCKSAIWVKL